MHDRIRLALSAAAIAVVTLAASGAPLPFLRNNAQAQPAHAAPMIEAVQAERAAPVEAIVPVISEAPAASKPVIRAPRIRRTAGADLTTA